MLRFRRSASAKIGLVLVATLIVFALVGPTIARYDPNTSDFSLARDAIGPPGPSSAHWLGTDSLFRDVFARLAAGARLSLGVALAATAMSMVVGATVGVVSGYLAGTRFGFVDVVLMRVVDVLLAIPYLLFVMAIGAAIGRAEIGTLLLVLGLTSWTGTARVVRAKTLTLREAEFVLAARALGARAVTIIARHIVPNVASTLIVLATTAVGQMILAEAVLGYLTVGAPPPHASWGRMLHEAEHYLGTRLSLVAAPGLSILLAVLGFNRLGEGLREALEPGDRTMPETRLPLDLVLAALAFVVAAAATPNALRAPHAAAGADAPRRGGTLHLATMLAPRALDPAIAYDEEAVLIEEHLFARLVTWDANGDIVGDLAREVTPSADGTRYVFALRRGVAFHDGAELTASDVKRTIERTLHPKTPCPAASLYDTIVGFAEYRAGKAEHLDGVRVLDDSTVAVDLREPDATFLPKMTLAFVAPVCPSSGATVDPKKVPLPCGAGPFRLESWDSDRGLRIVRHERYFKSELPYLDAIEWQTNVRPGTQRYELEDGQIDYCRDLTGADSAEFRASAAWSGLWRSTPRRAIYGLFMNTEAPPFDKVEVRRAVAQGVDASVLGKIRSDVMPTDRMLPDSIPGPDRALPMRRFDPNAALEHMARAGYAFDPTTGKGGYPESVEYIVVPDTLDQQVAEVYQQQLARIGIRIRLRLVTFATYLAEVSRRGGAVMGTVGWSADFPDPSNFFEPTLSSSAIADEGSQNYAFFSNATFDEVLMRAHRESDPARRMELYAQAETIVRDEAPWVPTYVTRTFEVRQGYLRGYASHPIRGPLFTEAWLDDATGPRIAALLRAHDAVGSSPVRGSP